MRPRFTITARLLKPTPFGSDVNTRGYSAGKYRFGFNGQEKAAETVSDAYDFGARIYDARLGRWLAVDPLQKKYAYLSPFTFTANNPICFKEIDGKDFIYSIDEKTKTITVQMTVYSVSQKTYDQALAGANLWNQTKFQSKGYTVKFDIQVQNPPAISKEDVVKANIENQKLFKRNGKPSRAYKEIENSLKDEQMLRDAQNAYASGEIGKNNVYAGDNNFGGLRTNNMPAPPEKDELRELGVSNGKAIVTHKVALTDNNINTPGSGFSLETKYCDQGEKPYVVGHEIGHNLGLPDYTEEGLKSGGIMDYMTAEIGKPSQIEVDDLVTQIINYNQENKDKSRSVANVGYYGNAQFKRE